MICQVLVPVCKAEALLTDIFHCMAHLDISIIAHPNLVEGCKENKGNLITLPSMLNIVVASFVFLHHIQFHPCTLNSKDNIQDTAGERCRWWLRHGWHNKLYHQPLFPPSWWVLFHQGFLGHQKKQQMDHHGISILECFLSPLVPVVLCHFICPGLFMDGTQVVFAMLDKSWCENSSL